MSNNLNNRVSSIENSLATITELLSNFTGSAPVLATSARIRPSADNAYAKSKSKGRNAVEDVEIEITRAKAEGRMKLPARMFTSGSTVMIDGHKFLQQEHDQNRSQPFSPSWFDAEEGDTIVFSHVKGREWTAQVYEGQKPAKRTASKASPKTQTKTKSKVAPTKAGSSKRATRTVAELMKDGDVRKMIGKFADIAIDNANEGITNDNIVNSETSQTRFKGKDARMYLIGKDSRSFRKASKDLGLTLDERVALLNSEVFE